MNGVIEFLAGWLLLSVVLAATICRAINKTKGAERRLLATLDLPVHEQREELDMRPYRQVDAKHQISGGH